MRKFLHLGSGPIILRSPEVEWVNIDISPAHNPDICMDYQRLTEVFSPNSIAGIASIHSFEHLVYPDGVVRALEQCHTVLQAGGVLRLVVPDLMKVAKKYVNGEDLKDIYDGPYFIYKDRPAERFMQFCRLWEHQILFDERLLTELMLDAGFRNVRVMPFGVSTVSELCGIDRFRSESCSLEGEK